MLETHELGKKELAESKVRKLKMTNGFNELVESLEWLKTMALRYSENRMFEYQVKTEQSYKVLKDFVEKVGKENVK
jgi:hypothetical protein